MLLCFGAAWPFSIYRSYKSRSTKGKSLVFLIILLAGYVAGIINKLVNYADIVIVFYCINLIMVLIDMGLYIRNYFITRNGECECEPQGTRIV
jgi:hypothetical protein